MKKLSTKQQIFLLFFIWRLGLFLFAFISTLIIKDFGGRFPYYQELLIATGLPNWVWGFGNFDGVHYLNIALNGYFAQYTQVFFPLFPLLIFITGKFIFFSTNLPTFFLIALTIPNVLFLISLFLLYRLFKIDYSEKTSLRSIIFLLSFPTAFYFGSIYTESLFLFLTVLTLLLIRERNYLTAGFIGGLTTATRILGIGITAVVFIETILSSFKKKGIERYKNLGLSFLVSLLSILGLLIYMIYLSINFNDPLYFLNAQPAFGAERSNLPFVLLPQVFFRYIKILSSVPINTMQFWNAFLELFFSITTILALILSFKKIRLSYWVFSLLCFIIPTLTGTLSSMPRYVLMCFLIIPFIVESLGRYFKLVIGMFIILQVILLSLFIRGYWVA